MQRSDASSHRIFLTFAAGDVAVVRRVVPALTSDALRFDDAMPSGGFRTERADIIRASLTTRLRHSAGALCLYGRNTLDDDWVAWALSAARQLRLPVLGAPLGGASTNECAGLLVDLGVDLVPLDAHRIASRFEEYSVRPDRGSGSPGELADTLRMMRHPVR